MRAKLWPISLRESFDKTNPWMPRVTGLGMSREQRKQRLYWVGAGILLLLLLAGWIVAMHSRDRQQLTRIGDLSWGLCAAFAFIAPSLGAAARRRLDFDRCLRESFATSITDREYVSAIHANILMQAAIGFVLSGIVALALAWILFFPSADIVNPVVSDSLLRLYMRMIDYNDMLNYSSNGLNILILLTALVMAANYAAGVYVHASVLASYCQRDRMTSIHGGIMTALLIVFMMLFLFVRYFVILDYIDRWLPGEIVGNAQALGLLVIDGLLLAARLIWARLVWRDILRRAMDETRSFLV